jgi:hypothetical protein
MIWPDSPEPVIEDYPPAERRKLLLDAANEVLGDIEHVVEPEKSLRIAQAEELVDQALTRVCEICGCTDDAACSGGCYWLEPGLCSRCGEEA